jgi:N-ethylmaleimide reductase
MQLICYTEVYNTFDNKIKYINILMKRHFSTNIKNLFSPIKLGPYELRNRTVMAAMTRCRADPKTAIPNDMHVQYYSERAENAGFILTECAAISRGGNTFPGACGIFDEAQTEAWKKVCDAVHEKNGRIYMQIWHGGRSARKMVTGERPVAPSNVTIRSFGQDGKTIEHSEEAEVLTEDGIKKIVEEFQKGAENALKAGFDGLQLHGANGYLVDEFLRDGTNKREDKFGGSFENRSRFPLMVMDALTSVFASDRVGIKLSPVGRYNDMFDSNPIGMFSYLLKELNKRKISFVELVRGPELFPVPDFYDAKPLEQIPDMFKTFRPVFENVLIGNSNLSQEEAQKLIKDGEIDMASFGRPFIANPDFPKRLVNNWPLAEANHNTIYYGGSDGYISYPKYQP